MITKKVKITETYTYELILNMQDNENLDDVVHETENIRNMSEEEFAQITKRNFNTTFDYEEI